ncbi:hypothetical protein [Roseateles sp. L2-2]|uniref:hypothetical protein n=1 Tax=Roseateles TaxID=93681 RepID=UPI003D3648FD
MSHDHRSHDRGGWGGRGGLRPHARQRTEEILEQFIVGQVVPEHGGFSHAA